FRVRVLGRQPGFMGMDPDRRVQERMLLRQLDARVEARRTVAIADRDHSPHSRLARPCDDLLAIGVKLLAIEMGVRIDEHAEWSCLSEDSLLECPPNASSTYFSLAPTGT